VRIEEYDPKVDEDRLRSCHEMIVSAQPEDDPNVPPPSLGRLRGWLTHGFPDEPPRCFCATTDSGSPLGYYALDLPQRENRHNAFINLLVGVGSRRSGIGTAMLAHAADQAKAGERGTLLSGARVGGPGNGFATAVGAKSGMKDARRILDVGPNLHARLPELRKDAESHSSGYVLHRWIGATPEFLVAGACQLNEAMADAPHDEGVQPIEWDRARLRAAEQISVIQGTREYSVAAIQDSTGEMAALTQVTVDPADAPGWAHQQLTAVTRAHRGHRLGMLLKVAMLEWLATAEPQIRQIVTFNAVPNEHMIAVNEALGHRVSDYFQSFELPVEAALKLSVSA
jgi:GNAT superfamily N-acetyltransferase